MGTALHDLGPLDGNGLVQSGVSIECSQCKGIFMVVARGLFRIGGSIWDLKDKRSSRPLSCPYCGLNSFAEASRMRVSDTRPLGGDD